MPNTNPILARYGLFPLQILASAPISFQPRHLFFIPLYLSLTLSDSFPSLSNRLFSSSVSYTAIFLRCLIPSPYHCIMNTSIPILSPPYHSFLYCLYRCSLLRVPFHPLPLHSGFSSVTFSIHPLSL